MCIITRKLYQNCVFEMIELDFMRGGLMNDFQNVRLSGISSPAYRSPDLKRADWGIIRP
jgi:hypothetical protein